MKAINWVRWLLAGCLFASVLSTGISARQKFRHPQPPIYKKSWPIGPRISMGNSIHINTGHHGVKYNRPNIHKQLTNYKRYPLPNPGRRPPPPMFAVIPPSWKTQQTMLGSLPNQGSLPQRGPVKEFHSIMNKLTEYSPEYRREQLAVPTPTNRGEVDDDKGPIHTIPAPNLSPADKPYNLQAQTAYPSSLEYPSVQSGITNYVFGTSGGTSLTPQRITTGPTSPTPTHYYEVTETNEIGVQDYRTVQPSYSLESEFDRSVKNFPTTGTQINDIFSNSHSSGSNTGSIGTNIQFDRDNSPMQTNLQSSLHVGFPGSAAQQALQTTSSIDQQTPDLHVGHPAPAGPPLSANQLYDLLNSFPQQFNDQYNAGTQNQILHQQLDQILQSGNNPEPPTQFSQPQMHSFNYDEQSNKLQQLQQQQQQIFVGQDYASGRVTADYSLEPDNRNVVRNVNNFGRQEVRDNSANNVEYKEETGNRQMGEGGVESTYFTRIGEDGTLSSQFYTTLPSREAAEKLAALAAAGNVNSNLIGQLRKQEMKFNQELSLPYNHKDERYNVAEEKEKEEEEEEEAAAEGENDDSRYQEQTRYMNRVNDQREDDERQQNQRRAHYQEETEDNNRPLRIMVPDLEEYSDDFDQRNSRRDTDVTKDSRDDYEYDDINEEPEIPDGSDNHRQQSTGNDDRRVYGQHENSEFGSRLTAE